MPKLSDYEILNEVGKGSYGSVFKAIRKNDSYINIYIFRNSYNKQTIL